MTTYYISPTGSDSNAGTPFSPWATIPHADTVVQPGDTVMVLGGTYTVATTAWRTNSSGTAGNPITYITANPQPYYTRSGGNAILSSTVPYTAGFPWVWDQRGSYVTIIGFEITGVNTPVGIDFNGGTHCRALGNYIHDLGTSVPNTQPGAGLFDSGLNGSQYNEFAYNVINTIGIQNTGGNQFTHGIYPGASYDFIHHNIISNCSGWGIHALGDSYLGGCSMHHPIVANNLCFDNVYGGLIFATGDASTTDYMYCVNNIFAYNGKLGVLGWGVRESANTGVNSIYDHNLTFGNTEGSYELLNGLVATHQIAAAPNFVNYLAAGGGDYHPVYPSPTIDAGTSTLPGWNTYWSWSTDLDGNALPQGAAIDLGPYEYVFASSGTPVVDLPAQPPIPSSALTTIAELPSHFSRYKQQVVLVYNSSGTFLDVWRDAPLLSSFKEAINSAPTPIQVTLPRPLDNFDEAGSGSGRGTVGVGNRVDYWIFGPGLPTNGQLRFRGVIDRYEAAIDAQGNEGVTVTITPHGAALSDEQIVQGVPMGNAGATTSSTAVTPGSQTIVVASATNLAIGQYIPIDTGASLEYVTVSNLVGTSLTATFAKSHTGTYNVGGLVDPAAVMFPYWFNNNDTASGKRYTYPLTLDGASILSSGITSFATFINQSLLDIFNTILAMLYNDSPNWFYRVNVDTDTVLLSKTPTTAQHVFVVAQHIAEPSFAKDATGLKNVILVTGGTNNIQAIARGSDLSTYGVRTHRVSESRLASNAQAQVLANGLLVNLDQIIYRFKIRVMDYRGDVLTGLGYDIESIRVGDSCQLLNPTVFPGGLNLGGAQAEATWDASLWDSAVWNGAQSFTITPVMQIVSLSYGWDYVDLEVGGIGPNQDVSLLHLQNEFQDWTVGVA